MYICNPSRANTERENTVRMITSRRFFTDSMTAPTMVFRPADKEEESCSRSSSTKEEGGREKSRGRKKERRRRRKE